MPPIDRFDCVIREEKLTIKFSRKEIVAIRKYVKENPPECRGGQLPVNKWARITLLNAIGFNWEEEYKRKEE